MREEGKERDEVGSKGAREGEREREREGLIAERGLDRKSVV